MSAESIRPSAPAAPPVGITFSTQDVSQSTWLDNLRKVKEEDISELIIYCRFTIYSLEAELSDRPIAQEDNTLSTYFDTIQSQAQQINASNFVPEKQDLNDYGPFLAQEPSDSCDIEAARLFLWLVSRIMGWSHALLILHSLGKHKLKRLSEGRRVKLIKFMREKGESLFCPKLQEEAKNLGLTEQSMTPAPYVIELTKPVQVPT